MCIYSSSDSNLCGWFGVGIAMYVVLTPYQLRYRGIPRKDVHITHVVLHIQKKVACRYYYMLNASEESFIFCELRPTRNIEISAVTGDKKLFEPQHDKTKKITCAPSEDSAQPAHPRSVGSLGPNVSSCGQRRLIRLSGCPGWSESFLGARIILLFCRAPAHLPEALPWRTAREDMILEMISGSMSILSMFRSKSPGNLR